VKAGAVLTNESVTLIEPGISSLTYNGSDDQMAAFYCYPMTGKPTASEFADQHLLSIVAQHRLRESLRMQQGISYLQGVYRTSNPVFPNAAFTCLYAQFDPVNEIVAHESFRAVIDSFQTKAITKSELKRAREPYLSTLKQLEESTITEAFAASSSYSNPAKRQVQLDNINAVKAVKLKGLNAYTRANFDLADFHIFRVQHYQGQRAIEKKMMQIESHLGSADGQFKMGKFLLRSPDKKERQRGIDLLNQAGAQGLKEAYYEVGNFHSKAYGDYRYKAFEDFTDKDLKIVATAYELSGPLDKVAFKLATIYYYNYKLFPEVEDTHIMKLARQSAESGDAEGQMFLAERLKDGTITPRDEIGAMKWALISRHSKTGGLFHSTDFSLL